MLENLIVALIVLTACVLTVRSFLKSIRSGKCPSCKNCAFDQHDSRTHGGHCGGHGCRCGHDETGSGGHCGDHGCRGAHDETGSGGHCGGHGCRCGRKD